METNTALRIKQIREYRNYSQQHMATQLGIQQNTYSDVENGVIPLTLPRLNKIAKILKVPADVITNPGIPLFNLDPKQDKEYSNKDIMEQLEKMTAVMLLMQEQNKEIMNALKAKLKNNK